jgi:7-cyano-7-deazaguanine synthase
MDSAVALWWAKRQGYRCHALSFDYGQRHRRELTNARRLAKQAKVPWESVRFHLPWGGSTLTNKNLPLPQRKLRDISHTSIPSTYVPGRNTIFLSFALSWADQKKAQAIVIGANAIDYSGYPDCRPNFLKAFERVAVLGSKSGTENHRRIKILSPLLHLTKAQIVRLGRKLKVPLASTWSCYQGGKEPCGRCDSCILRDKGFAEADRTPRRGRAR